MRTATVGLPELDVAARGDSRARTDLLDLPLELVLDIFQSEKSVGLGAELEFADGYARGGSIDAQLKNTY